MTPQNVSVSICIYMSRQNNRSPQMYNYTNEFDNGKGVPRCVFTTQDDSIARLLGVRTDSELEALSKQLTAQSPPHTTITFSREPIHFDFDAYTERLQDAFIKEEQ